MDSFVLQKGIVLIEINGVFLLVADQEGRKYCNYIKVINETGAFIWNQLKDHRSLDEIVSNIQDEYEILDSYHIRKDVNAFIQLLKEGNYIA